MKNNNAMKRRPFKKMTERGFASIIVTTVLIAVIGLILVGFSISVRRNQRETLDRQLSTQAYYAAETAVNKARADVIEQFKQNGEVESVEDCGDLEIAVSDIPGVVAPCVTVDSSVSSMFYNSVVEGQDTYATVINADSSQPEVTNLLVTWFPPNQPEDPQIGCAGGSGDLPPRGEWPDSCLYGVIRLDITESDKFGKFNPLAFSTSVLLMPSDGSTSNVSTPLSDAISHNSAMAGTGAYYVGADECGAGSTEPAGTELKDRWCSRQIDITNPDKQKKYYVRMRSIYRNSSVDIQPRNGSTPVLTSGQILIDATGKAQDVLRRIQVRVPVDPGNGNVFGAIESTGSICKRFATAPNLAIWGGGTNGLCQD